MIVLSWDIGISNLAWCLLSYYPEENVYDIFDWNVINFMDPNDNKKKFLCKGIIASGNRKGSLCNKSAFYIDDEEKGIIYCKQHYPYKKNLNDEKKVKKNDKKKKVKKVKKKNIPLQMLAESLTNRLDDLDILNKRKIDVILIESQPKFATSSIKHVMDYLLCYLAIRSLDNKLNHKIITISAKRKLSLYDGPHVKCNIKDQHSRNKFLGVAYCKYMLNNYLTNGEDDNPYYTTPDWLSFYESIKKKDDLADSFLQGAWYLKNNI